MMVSAGGTGTCMSPHTEYLKKVDKPHPQMVFLVVNKQGRVASLNKPDRQDVGKAGAARGNLQLNRIKLKVGCLNLKM